MNNTSLAHNLLHPPGERSLIFISLRLLKLTRRLLLFEHTLPFSAPLLGSSISQTSSSFASLIFPQLRLCYGEVVLHWTASGSWPLNLCSLQALYTTYLAAAGLVAARTVSNSAATASRSCGLKHQTVDLQARAALCSRHSTAAQRSTAQCSTPTRPDKARASRLQRLWRVSECLSVSLSRPKRHLIHLPPSTIHHHPTAVLFALWQRLLRNGPTTNLICISSCFLREPS